MFGLFSGRRPTPGRLQSSVRLRLEQLELRSLPSDMMPMGSPLRGGTVQPPLNQAPQIVEFTAEEIGNGLFVLRGRVVDENPTSLVINFGGDTSCNGTTTTVQADGTFTKVVQLRVDGTDSGYITAQTTDPMGLTSNVMEVFVSPTPP